MVLRLARLRHLLALVLSAAMLCTCGPGAIDTQRGGTNITAKIYPASEILHELFNGQAQLLVENQTFGENFNMHFLSSRWDEGVLYSYYVQTENSGKSDERTNTHLALSLDGTVFENFGIVIDTTSDTRIASFPGIWKDGDTWFMVYETAFKNPTGIASELRLATSTDGFNWTSSAQAIWVPSADWQSVNIGTPCLWKNNNTWYVFYHGYDGVTLNVGLLVGDDLFALSPANSNLPILTVGTGWDSGTIGKRSIIKEGRYYYMVYEGSTYQHINLGFGGSRWGIGLARSTDLITWEKSSNNPILSNPNNGFGFDGPEFVKTPDGKLHIYFRNPSGSTSRATLF